MFVIFPYLNVQAVFLGHQAVDVHAVCLQNKLSQMTVEENGLSLLYGVSTTDNRSGGCCCQLHAALNTADRNHDST